MLTSRKKTLMKNETEKRSENSLFMICFVLVCLVLGHLAMSKDWKAKEGRGGWEEGKIYNNWECQNRRQSWRWTFPRWRMLKSPTKSTRTMLEKKNNNRKQKTRRQNWYLWRMTMQKLPSQFALTTLLQGIQQLKSIVSKAILNPF